MARLLRIEKCEQCGWCSFYDDKCLCVNPHKYFDPEDGIPDWCPLPEAEETTASEWISTSEREPTEGVSVPVVVEHGDGTRALATGVYMGRGLEWSVNGYMRVVTHWLDIPPLPEEASDEN